MENYHPMDSFDATAAADYEHLRGDEADTVDFLAGLAGAGPVLELAIGSGRVALPLTERGPRVDGVSCRRIWSSSCGPSRAAPSWTW